MIYSFSHLKLIIIQTYYAPYHSRRNLRVLTNAHVARILTRKAEDGLVVATSVEFVFEGKTYTASVRKEAIVCAGYEVRRLFCEDDADPPASRLAQFSRLKYSNFRALATQRSSAQ